MNEDKEVINLTHKGAEAVFTALENPPPINDKLREAAERFKGGFKWQLKKEIVLLQK